MNKIKRINYKYKLLVPFVSLLILSIIPISSGDYEAKYIVTANSIFTPVGRYVVLKKDNNFGVIRFIESEKKKAICEWYYGINSKGEFSKQYSEYGTIYLRNWFIPIWGAGIQLGNVNIKFGDINVLWSSNSGFCVDRDNDEHWEVEVSPTGWSDIEKVNVFDDRLKWYSFDPNRKEEIIEIEILPQ